MASASAAEIDQFLQDTLCFWVSSCLNQPTSISSYSVFTDGSIFVDILTQIEPDLKRANLDCYLNQHQITSTRIKVFNFVIKSLQKIYEEELFQVILCVPDCVCLGREPQSKSGLENMKLLLLLMLGCAVQCNNKENFITKIKEIPFEIQKKIADYIVKITDNQNIVMSRESLEKSVSTIQLIQERDNYMQKWIAPFLVEQNNNSELINNQFELSNSNDFRVKINQLKQELDEKSDFIGDLKSKFEQVNTNISKLKLENEELMIRVRKNSVYRDEADAMREKANRVDELEQKVKRLQKELDKMYNLQMKNKELVDDNLLLTEAKLNLEKNISTLEQKTKKCFELEMELIEAKSTIDRLAQANEAAIRRIQEVVEENVELQNSALVNQSLNSNSSHLNDYDYIKKSTLSLNEEETLLEQLSNKNKNEIIRLEVDNRKLLSENDHVNEENLKLVKKLEKLNEQVEFLRNEKSELMNDKRNMKKQIAELQSIKNQQNEEVREMKLKLTSQTSKTNQEMNEKLSKLEMELKNCNIEKSNLENDLFEERMKIKQIKEFLIKLCKTYDPEDDKDALKINCNDDLINGNYTEDRNVEEIMEKLSVKSSLLDSNQYNLVDEIKELKQKLNAQRNTFNLAKNQLIADNEELLQKLQETKKAELSSANESQWKKLHDQVRIDYDQLFKEQETLKEENRDLRSVIDELESKLSYSKEKISILEHSITLNDVHNDKFKDLQVDHVHLKDDFQKLFDDNIKLYNKHCSVNNSYKDLLNEYNDNKRHYMELIKEHKIQAHCNLMLEDIRMKSMNLVEHILVQYQELLNYTMSDKDRYYHDTQEFTDKFHELKRQKSSLELKLMNYYQNLNNSSSMKKMSGVKLMDRFKKVGGDLRYLFKRKQEFLPNEPTSLPIMEHVRHHGSTEPANNPLYMNENNQKTENNSILGSIGSRRGVYISEQDGLLHNYSSSSSNTSSPKVPNSNFDNNNDNGEVNNNQQSSNGQNLMYLRVSNVYNNNERARSTGNISTSTTRPKSTSGYSKHNFPIDSDDDNVVQRDHRPYNKCDGNSEWHEFGVI